MDSFSGTLIEDNRTLLDRALNHPFVARLTSGDLADEDLLRWLSQTYLYMREYEQVLCQLAVRSPDTLHRSVLRSLHSIRDSIESFEEYIARTVSNLIATHMSHACHAYAHFMLACVHVRSFEESIVACYGADYPTIQTWIMLAQTHAEGGMWRDVAAVLNQPGFGAWLDGLASYIDRAAETASPEQRRLMAATFPIPIHYRIRFLDDLENGTDW